MNINLRLSRKAWVILTLIVIPVLIVGSYYLFAYVYLPSPEFIDDYLNEPFGGVDYTDERNINDLPL